MKKIKYIIIIISTLFGFSALFQLSYNFINVYPKTDKLELLLNSNLEYGDNLKYVKLKGKVNQVYRVRYGIFFGVKPIIFEYTKDSIINKKIFYVDKKGFIWFFQRGENKANLLSLQKGDWLEKDFGELKFNMNNKPPATPKSLLKQVAPATARLHRVVILLLHTIKKLKTFLTFVL